MNAEYKFKQAVDRCMAAGVYPSAKYIALTHLFLFGHVWQHDDLNGRQCKWREDLFAQLPADHWVIEQHFKNGGMEHMAPTSEPNYQRDDANKLIAQLRQALDQALARCERAEKRVEELRGAGTQCAKLVAAWYAGEEWFTTDDAMAALRKWDAALGNGNRI